MKNKKTGKKDKLKALIEKEFWEKLVKPRVGFEEWDITPTEVKKCIYQIAQKYAKEQRKELIEELIREIKKGYTEDEVLLLLKLKSK